VAAVAIGQPAGFRGGARTAVQPGDLGWVVVVARAACQQPAHGTSFPSGHTAVTLAVVLVLVPFLARPVAATGIGYAVLVGWSRVYLGVHYPLDILGGAGIGMAVGGVILLALAVLLRGTGRAANSQNAATGPGPLPAPAAGHDKQRKGPQPR
jgi:membrane-associated phospholipid phosphatase